MTSDALIGQIHRFFHFPIHQGVQVANPVFREAAERRRD
jgi:hypothetical protein